MRAIVHNTLLDARNAISEQASMIKDLGRIASKHPYYKYNSMWTRDIQDAVGSLSPKIATTNHNRSSRLFFAAG